MQNIRLLLLSVALAVGFFFVGQWLGRRPADGLAPVATLAADESFDSPIPLQQRFPDFALENRDGESLALSSLYDGRGVYLLVLSAACGGCESEVERWRREFALPPGDVQVVGVLLEGFSTLGNEWAPGELPFPLYRDRDGALQQAGLRHVPSGFGIDAQGDLVVADHGIRTPPGERLEALRAAMGATIESPFQPARARTR